MIQIGNTQPGGNATGSLYANPAQAAKPQNGDDANSQQASAASGSVDVTSAAPPAASQAVSPPGTDFSPAYTVEISEEGAQLSSQAAAASDAASSGAAAGAATTTESESDTANLSIYSDYQLQQMLGAGKITQSEYNAEIAKRAAKKQTEAARENTLLTNVK